MQSFLRQIKSVCITCSFKEGIENRRDGKQESGNVSEVSVAHILETIFRLKRVSESLIWMKAVRLVDSQ